MRIERASIVCGKHFACAKKYIFCVRKARKKEEVLHITLRPKSEVYLDARFPARQTFAPSVTGRYALILCGNGRPFPTSFAQSVVWWITQCTLLVCVCRMLHIHSSHRVHPEMCLWCAIINHFYIVIYNFFCLPLSTGELKSLASSTGWCALSALSLPRSATWTSCPAPNGTHTHTKLEKLWLISGWWLSFSFFLTSTSSLSYLLCCACCRLSSVAVAPCRPSGLR